MMTTDLASLKLENEILSELNEELNQALILNKHKYEQAIIANDEELSAMRQALVDDKKEAKQMIKYLKDKLTVYENQVEFRDAMISDIAQSNKDLEKQQKDLNTHVKEERSNAQKGACELRKLRLENETLSGQIKAFKEQTKELNRALSVSKQKHESLSKAVIKECQTQNEQYETEMNVKKAEIKDYKKDLDAKDVIVRELRNENRAITEESKSLTMKLNESADHSIKQILRTYEMRTQSSADSCCEDEKKGRLFGWFL